MFVLHTLFFSSSVQHDFLSFYTQLVVLVIVVKLVVVFGNTFLCSFVCLFVSNIVRNTKVLNKKTRVVFHFVVVIIRS